MRVRLNQQRLLAHLAQSRLSQNHWALKLGLSRGHWSEIVNGKHPYPSPKTRERMLEVLGLPFDDLFEVETEAPSWADTDFRRAIAARVSSTGSRRVKGDELRVPTAKTRSATRWSRDAPP